MQLRKFVSNWADIRQNIHSRVQIDGSKIVVSESPPSGTIIYTIKKTNKRRKKQDCIPVGCVPPAHWPYLPACCVPGGAWSRGVPGLGGAWSRGCLVRGVCLVRGGCVPGPGGWYPSMHWGRPPVNRITNRCKNITLPQTSFADGKNTIQFGTEAQLFIVFHWNPAVRIKLNVALCEVPSVVTIRQWSGEGNVFSCVFLSG